MSNNIPNTFQHPNDFVDRLMPLLSDLEVVILTFAVRKILGWDEKRGQLTDRISLSQFEKTGRSRPAIIRALGVLHAANILIGDKSHAGKTGAEYEINLGQRGAYSLSALTPKRGRRLVTPVNQSNQLTGVTSTGKPELPALVNGSYPQNPLLKPTTKPKGGAPAARKPAGSPSVSKRSKKQLGAEPSVPPAVKVFQHVRSKFPPHETWDTIAGAVGDEAKSLELWREVLVAYAAAGHNRQAVDGPLDWFRQGGVPQKQGGARANGRKDRDYGQYWKSRLQQKRDENAKYDDYWDAKLKARQEAASGRTTTQEAQ